MMVVCDVVVLGLGVATDREYRLISLMHRTLKLASKPWKETLQPSEVHLISHFTFHPTGALCAAERQPRALVQLRPHRVRLGPHGPRPVGHCGGGSKSGNRVVCGKVRQPQSSCNDLVSDPRHAHTPVLLHTILAFTCLFFIGRTSPLTFCALCCKSTLAMTWSTS